MVLEKNKNLAFITHLSGFGSYFFPLGSIIIPFIIRETKKGDSKFMDSLTKDVINFNLSYLLYTFIIKLFVIPFFIGSIFQEAFNFNSDGFHIHFDDFYNGSLLISVLVIMKFVFIIKAVISINDGKYYKYPYTIEFIK